MRKTADNCYWQKSIILNQYPKLEENLKTDVLIIGGGVTGAMCAYQFINKGLDVTLIERTTVGTGSTLGSTSILHYEIDMDLQRLMAYVGEEHATESFKLCLDAVGQLEDIINTLDDKCEFVRRPSFYYTKKDEEYDYILDEYQLRKDIGIDVEFFDGKKDGNKYSFPFVAGIFSPNGGAEVNPVKLTNALLRYCKQQNMPIYENTEVIEYNLEGVNPVVKTKDGINIECSKIILACGYENLEFIDESIYSMTRTFTLVTKPVENFHGWFEKSLIKDSDDYYTYLRTTIDHRILIGGEDIEITPNDTDKLNMVDGHGFSNQKYHALRKKLEDMFPLIENKEIEFEFNGVFVDSFDGLPFIGEHDEYPNIYFNTAIGSNGLLYGLIGSKIILNIYLGNYDPHRSLFSFDRMD